ncbi:MAG: DNA polymerase III subunit chi [Proteobacteria bacterium]|nr:DNA polymerase III subunit chi [Pseudomonadota bacterium]
MSVNIQFYQLLTTPLDRALPKLLEKAAGSGFRTLLTASGPEQAEYLNQLLWTFDPASFLPHGVAGEGHEALQPVLISTEEAALNEAKLLVVTDGRMAQSPENYERIADIFDGRDATSLEAARLRWSQYKEKGFSMTYLRQTDNGGWDKKAGGQGAGGGVKPSDSGTAM